MANDFEGAKLRKRLTCVKRSQNSRLVNFCRITKFRLEKFRPKSYSRASLWMNLYPLSRTKHLTP